MRHVHADLVGAPRFQPAFDEAGLRSRIRPLQKPFDHLVMCDRLARIVARLVLDGPLCPVASAAERCIDRSFRLRGRPQTSAR